MDISQIVLATTETIQSAQETEGVLGTLGINWKLFLAQLVNFSIVLFVFWKWVVGPLGKTLTDRQNRIEEGLKNAEFTEAEKKKFEGWKTNEMKKVRTEADNILRTTTDTANKIKQDTIVEAQYQATKLLNQTRANIESEKVQALKEAKLQIATLVVAASEKILRGRLDEKKDSELIDESIRNAELVSASHEKRP